MIEWNNESEKIEENYEKFKWIVCSIDPNSFKPILDQSSINEREKENYINSDD